MEWILEGHEISINYLAEELSPSPSQPGGAERDSEERCRGHGNARCLAIM